MSNVSFGSLSLYDLGYGKHAKVVLNNDNDPGLKVYDADKREVHFNPQTDLYTIPSYGNAFFDTTKNSDNPVDSLIAAVSILQKRVKTPTMPLYYPIQNCNDAFLHVNPEKISKNVEDNQIEISI